MIATYNLNDVNYLLNIVKYLGGSSESTVIGYGFKVVAPNVIIANAIMSYSIDYDDAHLGSIIIKAVQPYLQH